MLIKGIPITLYKKTLNGYDDFGAPIYSETPVTINNVIVSPNDSLEVRDDLTFHGFRESFTLHIPKTDSNDWEGVRVSFFGKTFRQYGGIVEYIDELVPLSWNKKVMVERYV